MKNFPWDKNIYIIAEAGVNHNGNFYLAKKMIKKAKDAGADAIKFQTWVEGELTGKYTKKIGYVKRNFKTKLSRYEITNKLALSFKEFEKLKKYSQKCKIDFLTTPCGEISLNFIADILKVPYIKIGSSFLNNLSFLKKVIKKNRPILLSTGMSSFDEVAKSIKTIKSKSKKNIPLVVFQCTSEYPCSADNMNLNVIKTYKKHFKNTIIGLSDHSLGGEAGVASVALGAKVIEKHFTLNKKFNGPDHIASLDFKELFEFIKSIRTAEKMMGSFIKKPTISEKKIIPQTRIGIVAKKELKKGSLLKLSDIAFKRPATGFSMNKVDNIVGKKIKRNLKKDEPIKRRHI